jgi:hypothetical protein
MSELGLFRLAKPKSPSLYYIVQFRWCFHCLPKAYTELPLPVISNSSSYYIQRGFVYSS